MNIAGWFRLNLERDEHLANAQIAQYAIENLDDGAGIIKPHLERIMQREVNLAWLAMVILDKTSEISEWSE